MTEKPPSAEKTAASAKSAAKGDDRNVVAVDKDYAGASLEDRLFLFWKNYRAQVLVVVAAAVLAIVGRFAWDSYQRSKEDDVRAEYKKAKAAGVDAERAFARTHAGHQLAGVALLDVADLSYKNADYSSAQRNYAAAAAALKDPMLAARARLGEAMSAVQAGDTAQGEPLLRKIATDTQVDAPLRIEAWYDIASMKASEHDGAAAQDALSKLMELKPSETWIRRAMQLGAQLPHDAAPATETPGAVTEPAPSAPASPTAPAAPSP